MKPLRIGTRGSVLAQWQANFIRGVLWEKCFLRAELVTIKTAGDKLMQVAVGQMGLKGVFIKELEDALLEGRVDLAVHSMKDVPTEIPRELTIPAITKREDPRDCLVSRDRIKLSDLPRGARVGTSSVRRQAQLRHHRPDLEMRDLRGNVDTRLRKLDEGQYDAIVVAKAGLDRLGASERITEVFSPEFMLPAVGQGALGIEAREGDRELVLMLEDLSDAETSICVAGERALLAELEGGCQVPVGARGIVEDHQLTIDGCVVSADGADYIRRRETGRDQEAKSIGRHLGRALLEAGADRILRQAGRPLGKQ